MEIHNSGSTESFCNGGQLFCAQYTSTHTRTHTHTPAHTGIDTDEPLHNTKAVDRHMGAFYEADSPLWCGIERLLGVQTLQQKMFSQHETNNEYSTVKIEEHIPCQARKQEFFRAGEVSENKGTLTNI